jgi:glycosyltransferase involved in cell wall biosynthesis
VNTRRLHIVMLAPFGIRPKGTLLARMLPLAQALTQRGHRIQIIAPPIHNPEDAGRRDSYGGVEVLHTERPPLPAPLNTLHQVAALMRPALHSGPDVLHLFKPKGYSGLAALLAHALRPVLPLVVDTDDWEGRGGWNDVLPYPPTAKALFNWQERDLPCRAQAVTVASRTLQTQVWGAGVPPSRVVYLPNGSNLPAATRPAAARPAATTMLLYTRFWEFDVRDIVSMLAGVRARRPDARLLVVGSGEQQQERHMLQLAQRAGLARAIDYRGWVEPASLPGVLAEADIALVPLDDTLINRARCSAKLLELMAAGLPLVAAQVGQSGEYIRDGESGLLVPPGQPAALAQAALRLLADSGLRQRLSAGAQAALAPFSWAALAPRAEHAYMLAQQSPHAPATY